MFRLVTAPVAYLIAAIFHSYHWLQNLKAENASLRTETVDQIAQMQKLLASLAEHTLKVTGMLTGALAEVRLPLHDKKHPIRVS